MRWIKDNGDEIETNDRSETIEHCKSIGWKEKKKSGRPKVVKLETKDEEDK